MSHTTRSGSVLCVRIENFDNGPDIWKREALEELRRIVDSCEFHGQKSPSFEFEVRQSGEVIARFWEDELGPPMLAHEVHQKISQKSSLSVAMGLAEGPMDSMEPIQPSLAGNTQERARILAGIAKAGQILVCHTAANGLYRISNWARLLTPLEKDFTSADVPLSMYLLEPPSLRQKGGLCAWWARRILSKSARYSQSVGISENKLTRRLQDLVRAVCWAACLTLVSYGMHLYVEHTKVGRAIEAHSMAFLQSQASFSPESFPITLVDLSGIRKKRWAGEEYTDPEAILSVIENLPEDTACVAVDLTCGIRTGVDRGHDTNISQGPGRPIGLAPGYDKLIKRCFERSRKSGMGQKIFLAVNYVPGAGRGWLEDPRYDSLAVHPFLGLADHGEGRVELAYGLVQMRDLGIPSLAEASVEAYDQWIASASPARKAGGDSGWFLTDFKPDARSSGAKAFLLNAAALQYAKTQRDTWIHVDAHNNSIPELLSTARPIVVIGNLGRSEAGQSEGSDRWTIYGEREVPGMMAHAVAIASLLHPVHQLTPVAHALLTLVTIILVTGSGVYIRLRFLLLGTEVRYDRWARLVSFCSAVIVVIAGIIFTLAFNIVWPGFLLVGILLGLHPIAEELGEQFRKLVKIATRWIESRITVPPLP